MINSPKEIATLYCKSAVEKAKMSNVKFALLAILGGMFIALGGLLTVVVVGGSPELVASNPGLAKFLAGALFPVGLIMVTIAGGDLFTSDCAGMMLPYLQREVNFKAVLKIWVLSYLFNFVGTQFVAYCMSANIGFFDAEPWRNYLHSMAESKVSMSFHDVFWKGVGANWLVCLGAWMGFGGKDLLGKAVGIWVPVMIFVTFGYEHSIANMFFIPAAIYSGADVTWTQFLTDNLIAATIGNIVGGAVLVGTIYWFVYMKGEKKETK